MLNIILRLNVHSIIVPGTHLQAFISSLVFSPPPKPLSISAFLDINWTSSLFLFIF